MAPNLLEIIVILIIVAIVFGFGKLSKISATAAKIKTNFREGLETEKDEEPIDITPRDSDDSAKSGHKPGTKSQPVEEAELVDEEE